jgi:UDP-glucose 6-dehydrogenase
VIFNILTDWDAFCYLPWAELGDNMNQKIVLDMRNMLDATDMIDYGFIYSGVGG